jgi:hypothetical protein
MLRDSRCANTVPFVPSRTPQLKPQDLLVLLKLATRREVGWSYPSLAAALGLSASEVHAAVKRALVARLAVERKPREIDVHAQNLLEFLVHGAKYAFPAVRGPVTRGHPTGRAAPVLRERIVSGDDLPPVWADPSGTTRGESLSPLYGSASALKAVVADPDLYAAVALVDAIRGGSARERKVASDLLEKMLTGRRVT